ncbi:hypothetical protein QEH52_07765 [Coraliomargarita sp. SDUM461003]|uniref:DUF7305 domain-containing protein n=1 Tax=Thalassobacterium maritimum TaxID=3041265 RepID=A0ABU1ATB0_9BACT|nr:hypothetical protein [Coraliomargarita sp. SDUM461003]MDQ8207400.1 hypothetical protein [Coraliomargarita sp. SDUM461003]
MHTSHGSRDRGSALISAMIFCFVVMTLMGSYLYMATTEFRVSAGSYLLGASFNLAEGGVDRALHALGKNDHTGWTTGTDAQGRSYWAQSFGSYDLGGNLEGVIKVVILNPTGSSPEIFSEGEASGRVSGAISKQVHASLSSGFYPFINGFNSKQGIVLKGNNVTFDSYDSGEGAYSWRNRNSEITVATISVESDAIDIGNADIYGYVATGGALPNVGPNGAITSYSNPGVVDAGRVTTDFYAQFPDISAPSLNAPSTSIPSSGTIAGGDYQLNSWSMSGKKILRITDDARIVVDGDISFSGKSGVEIASGATVKIYAKGNVSISGNGILNESQVPGQLLVFGIHTTEGGQSIAISGNGYLAAAVYAPNAVVTLTGGGNSGRVYGAVAAYSAALTGNSHFSYDEALENYNIGGAGFEVDEWTELSGVGLTSMRLNMTDYNL